MRVPPAPPNRDAVFEALANRGAAEFKRVVGIGWGFDCDDDAYDPWRVLRFKTPPVGLTPAQWWVFTRDRRTSALRKIPELLQIDGAPFSFALTDKVLREVEYVTANLSGQIGFTELAPSEPLRDRYVLTALQEEAITSSQLEGAATTRDVAKDMLRTGRAPRDRGERMIANNYAAMERVRELVGQPLTPSLIRELHVIVTEGTLDDPADAGRIQADQSHRVAVFSADNERLFRPPPVGELESRMKALCDFANKVDAGPYLPGVLRAITVHFMTGYNHFFADGNGRLARTLFYWVMLNEGYWLAEFVTISTILRKAPAKYGRAYLDTEQDGGDLTYFFLHQLGVLRQAIGGLRGYLDRKAAERRQTLIALHAQPEEFNHRQVAIMDAAIQDLSHSFTARSVAAQFGVTVPTARADLIELADRGFLVLDDRARQHVWTPVPDFASRLGSSDIRK